MKPNQLILMHFGNVTHTTTKLLVAQCEKILNADGEENYTKRKVLRVTIEALQNIAKHCPHTSNILDEAASGSSIFMISKEEKRYCVFTGNRINKSNAKNLSNILNDYNRKGKAEMKATYQAIISNGKISKNGCAGIGFLDMARKSGEKLMFDFSPINSQYDFFWLKVNISREKYVSKV